MAPLSSEMAREGTPTTRTQMSITQTSLAEILREHVTLKVESIDRMYLNVYVPKLQCESGASWFLRQQRKCPIASSATMAPISRAFVEAIEAYAQKHEVPVLTFEKGQRKDDEVAPYLKKAAGRCWKGQRWREGCYWGKG
jgi:hypothetical protein